MADERGQKLADAMFGPAFGFFPQMKPKRSKQDPEAAKNVPIDVARGFAAGALGAPGDIESLIRLLPGLDKKTILPTSEEILQRIPGGSDTPTSRAVAGAGTLAGGFYTGPGSGVRAALSLPSAIKRAGQDFAMAAGQSGSKIFIGPKAKTWNQAAADLAVQLEKSGVDPVDIWRQTGTFRGADGILRQEISDVGVIHRNPDQLKELGKNKLEEARELGLRLFGTPGQKDLFPKALTEAKKPVREQVKRLKEEVDELNRHSGYYGQRAKFALEHPELYKAYPELADIPVTQGTYDHGVRGSLRGGPSDMEMSVTWAGLQSDPRSTMLHEMQHAVQTLEDMAPGGSPAMAFQDPRAYEILERMRLEIKKPVSFEQFQIISKYPDENEARSAYEKYLKILASSPIERSIDIDLQKQAAMEYYNRLAGEAEARATQAREPMGPTERRQEFPYSSYDVLPEDLIVKPPKQSMAHGGPVHFSNSPDTMRLELAGGGAVKMNQGGASFGQYTTGKKYQAARQRAQESGAAEVIEGGLRGLFGLDPQEGAGARGMEAYRNMAAASSSPTPLALAALPAGVVKGVKGLAKAEKAAVVPLDIPLAKVKTPHERSLEQGYEHGWYHGTTGDVRSFDPKLRGETTGARSAQKGFFFVRDPQNPPEKMLVKSSDPQSVELMRKLGYADEQIAQQNKVSFEGHGAETASGYASLGGSRTYKEAMRKANAAERRGDWPEYEKQMSIAEDAEIGLSQELQSLVAKYGDVRDEMLDKIQKAVYDRQLPQAEAEALDQWYKSVMPYGWYNTFGTDKFFDNLSKELVKKVGEERAAPALEAMKQFLSVRNERALMEKTQEGSNVMPIALRYKKPYVYDYEGSSYRDESYSDLIDKALAGGHDALILKNTYDPGVGPAKLVDIGVVFDPAQIRSRFAKFNPENIQSSDITKAKGGAIKKIKISDNPDTMRLELMKAKG